MVVTQQVSVALSFASLVERRRRLYERSVKEFFDLWVEKVYTRNPVRFESIDGLKAAVSGEWVAPLKRLNATLNRSLFYGDAVIVYRGGSGFVPNDYFVGNDPGLFYEMEVHRYKRVDPLHGAQLIAWLPWAGAGEKLRNRLEKIGVPVSRLRVSRSVAFDVALGRALGFFLYRTAPLFSRYEYVLDRHVFSELSFFYILDTHRVMGRRSSVAVVSVRTDVAPKDADWSVEVALGEEAEEAEEAFRQAYRALTRREPSKAEVGKLHSTLRRVVGGLKKYLTAE